MRRSRKRARDITHEDRVTITLRPNTSLFACRSALDRAPGEFVELFTRATAACETSDAASCVEFLLNRTLTMPCTR